MFNKPIWIELNDGRVSRELDVYGFTLNNVSIPYVTKDIDDYLEYLAGVSKWLLEGNDVDGNWWYSFRTGKEHYMYDYFIKKYIKRARQQMHLSYLIIDTNKAQDTMDLYDGRFLTNRNIYNNIMEYGAIVNIHKTKGKK